MADVRVIADTSYPDLQIHDDWNDRLPKPVTSFADDVAKAGNAPDTSKRDLTDYVETSVGAVPADSETAKAAADVAMKEPKPADTTEKPAESAEKPAESAEKPAETTEAPRSVSRRSSAAS